ncbi:1,4-alpha-glucan branching enzyme [Pseudomonas daroniae]|uniref:1,4-alpha-glucan branching enzyme GlgB n=1 Tax=Phytopseudomonas daroniae TaxID=2487519 RepID=A0A4Q9QIS9_9GAMM|nr:MULTISPECIES: 1,4-alpha-glucan branching protein GlgB [Pseudomonas]TBU72778.1 1,4-alpha-glucan branching enzyme [Pseudomonas daroniae]TBU77744.1 1,4-alpha-glucan branching enzyme [Pseudomonas sp. FRB 228]TBU87706.1 1,4-alpha-glucan branching enzyme [Pseudomonas daroniae]
MINGETDRQVAGVERAAIEALVRAEHGDPFSILGPHELAHGLTIRTYLPGALGVELIHAVTGEELGALEQSSVPGLFSIRVEQRIPYRYRIHWSSGVQETEDPYAFGQLLGEMDLYLFAEGNHRELGKSLGAQLTTHEGVQGVRFSVWAPNARRVSVVGGFNDWDGRRHPMRLRQPSGVWELFIPRLAAGEVYKYEILGRDGLLPLKADPMALASELPPATGSVVSAPLEFDWRDGDWMQRRQAHQGYQAPMSIYEVHAGSWRHDGDEEGRVLSWKELGEQLIPYVQQLGFTHIELMPIMEHPFGGSWGYQLLSQFAPTARYGSPADFAAFVDACHQAGIGVILDWVPAHFPTDAHGLGQFDGTALYEYAHPFEGFHQDWDTYIYNLGRTEVHGFMLASALHWLRAYHIDGLRVDAVASMLYRDYSRKEGEWIPNRHGGRENLESIDFLRHLNDVVTQEVPGALVIAEESTAWPGVSRPAQEGGLGFAYKWNMGWMHDSLQYVAEDPLHRQHHHHQLTFGLLYAFSEHFVLPISHDEVVHGKRSLLDKMPGDRWQKFANLRLYLSFMWSHPGKKLLFMGCEFGQWREWNHDHELDWYLLRYGEHKGVQQLVSDLNGLYRHEPALHRLDGQAEGFAWLIGDDAINSVFAWLRQDESGAPLLVVHNFTPEPRNGYRVGVPKEGAWHVLLNSDAERYAGSNAGSQGGLLTEALASHGQPQSLLLDLPPLATLVIKPQ